ncbi:hypothetical protein F2P56_004810 [Juglans regia]|uniref:AT-rich interactive domain-containing protein 2-like isoform X1 n=2 Tax=Juglans regia TaxID=51240 RepID=A0A6P9EM59_JUGRE|nr:AT-rich interactive domain-containing protein 2-like isoform X1 [Juglans regia]KAF5478231.1 hypothetical protein F2P56_004810 [Juglans regia]
MAGCSIITNGSVLDCVEVVSDFQNNGRCLATDNSERDGVDDRRADYMVKLRCLFDQVLSVFLKEINSNGVIRPVPAMLGDGRSPDLFKLFWVVRERGGFDMVSKKGMWAFVAEESGLDLSVTSSVKLIYCKYLNELEKWFEKRCRDRKLGNGQYGCDGDFSSLSLELEKEFRGLLSDGPWRNKNRDVELVRLESCKSGKYMDMDIERSGFDISDTNIACTMWEDVSKWHSDDGENVHHDSKNIFNDEATDRVIISSSIARRELNFHKRKRESLAGMLNWVIQTAKHPEDPSVGVMPEPSKWKEHESKELLVQAMRAREALFLRRHPNPKTEGSLVEELYLFGTKLYCFTNFYNDNGLELQKKLKMHPSMYEDGNSPSHQSTERLRCSERLPASVKCRACSCCNSCSPTQSKLSPRKIELDNGLKEQEPVTDNISATNTIVSPPGDDPPQKQVCVDSHLQAEVPEWTGVVSESDSKWLGTCVWPLKHEKHNGSIKTDPIGRGRPYLCGCRLPGSVECVRFHIAEKRMKLKLELGSMFYCWRFDRMGEEVSLQWTNAEEQRFKNMVRSNLSDNAFKYFPGKTRENLVSYYFNVFLVRRRTYQNHVTPKNVDSDDDESEFGSLSDGFGHEALKVPGSKFPACSDNKQCTDFE